MILFLVMLIGLVPVQAFASEENLWSGRSAVFVGDSITAGSNTTKTYYSYLEENLGFGSVTAMGVSGSCISAASDYGQSNQPLINRYQNIPSSDLSSFSWVPMTMAMKRPWDLQRIPQTDPSMVC